MRKFNGGVWWREVSNFLLFPALEQSNEVLEIRVHTLAAILVRRAVGVTVRRERRWTSAGATPARKLVRSTRSLRLPHLASTF